MPPDDDHLRDMVQAARKTLNHSSGLTRDDFYASELHQSAVKYELQVIGEAASNVSRETRDINSAIQWANIIGMRQHLVHGHRTVDLEIVWEPCGAMCHNCSDSLSRCSQPARIRGR